jgi:hypothetical protein
MPHSYPAPVPMFHQHGGYFPAEWQRTLLDVWNFGEGLPDIPEILYEGSQDIPPLLKRTDSRRRIYGLGKRNRTEVSR